MPVSRPAARHHIHRLVAVLATLAAFILTLPGAPALASPPQSQPQSGHYDVKSAILMDMGTRKVLYEQDADRPIPPASITKILTMYMVLESIQQGQLKPRDLVKVSARAGNTGGTRMFLKAGETTPVAELLKGMAVSSANDACVAAAEHMSGSEAAFVARMNAKARQIGMDDSVFMNPHGLPAKGQMTTARDMLKLSDRYLRNFPEALKFHSMRTLEHNRVVTHNRNRLLGACEGVDGIKTGWVSASGYNLVATAKRGKTRLIGVVLGAPTPAARAAETERLLEDGFQTLTEGRTQVRPAMPKAPILHARYDADDEDDAPARSAGRKPAGAAKSLASSKKLPKDAKACPVPAAAPAKAGSVLKAGAKSSAPQASQKTPAAKPAPVKKAKGQMAEAQSARRPG